MISFTNGATIKVNETGSILFYSPGMLIGGNINHKCNKNRAVSYYIEVQYTRLDTRYNIYIGYNSPGAILCKSITSYIE